MRSKAPSLIHHPSQKIDHIGNSGTGSIVVEQLGRLGVGEFVFVDPDAIEAKNLNRILNATSEDAVNRKKNHKGIC